MDKIGMGVVGGLALLGIVTIMLSRKKTDVVQVIQQPAQQTWVLGSNPDRDSMVTVPLSGGKSSRKRIRKNTKKL